MTPTRQAKLIKITKLPLFYFSLLGLLILSGCRTQGISGPSKTTTLGYDLQKIRPKMSMQSFQVLPFHLVVAQAGALSPEKNVLDELKKHPKLFKKISVIPASPEMRNLGREVYQKDPHGLLAQAESLGGDLLLLIGGKVESTSSRTPASILDLTIVGRYLIPSNNIQGKASVMGVVINLKKHELVMTVNEEIKQRKFSPSVSRVSNEDKFVANMREEILGLLTKSFVAELADRSGVIRDEKSGLVEVESQKVESKKANVYILSDGLHVSLILPYQDHFGEGQYVEIGLGERNWVIGKGWKWMDAILSMTAANDGVAVMETLNESQLQPKFKKIKRVWKVELNERDYGKMLVTLEEDLSFQEVIYDGVGYKVIKNLNGYNLFHTCHQFALNPLGITGKGLFDSIPRPTPILESRIDRFLTTNGKVIK